MYDSALRAQLVYAALKEAYASKVEEQKQREIVGAPNSLLADTDIPEVSERLAAVGVNVQGEWQHSEYSIEMPAEFRGVQVTVVLPAQLACNDVVGNPVLIEIEARDFMSMENGDHSWTRALPLNERDVHKEGDCQLDAISLTVKGHTLHALLLERPLSTAASFFGDLAHTACQEFSPTAVGAVTMRYWGGYREVLGRLQSGNDAKTHCRPSQNLKIKTNWKKLKPIGRN